MKNTTSIMLIAISVIIMGIVQIRMASNQDNFFNTQSAIIGKQELLVRRLADDNDLLIEFICDTRNSIFADRDLYMSAFESLNVDLLKYYNQPAPITSMSEYSYYMELCGSAK